MIVTGSMRIASKSLILEGKERWQEALTGYGRALRNDSTSMDALVQKREVLVQLKDEVAPTDAAKSAAPVTLIDGASLAAASQGS